MKKIYILTILLFIGVLSQAQENSLNFDGNNDVVDLTNNSIFDITSSITLEAWIYPTLHSTEIDIISKFGDVAVDDSYMLRLANGVPFIQIKIGATWFVSSDITALSLNTWHHIAGVYDGTQLKIFVNGILKNSVSQTGNIGISSSTVKIGRWLGSAASFSGNIDEVRIWNIARSDIEIASNYNKVLVGNEAGLVSYYRFNQGIANGNNPSETSLTDISINNVNGTLNTFSLSGTTSNWVGGIDFSTLSTSDNNFNTKEKKLFPNPATEFLIISGLTKTEAYKIYNVLGIKVNVGIISNNGKINIQSLTKGIYFLKFKNGNTIKFIKE
jgi:Concanavalin A-like lectin/glucanases superfamily/Secretion system C-terminal sorting domain